ANQIAAGEVVERPASAIKELIENSLDAAASQVEIGIRNGGKTELRVADDGHGMARDDALLAIDRHATSKIRDEKDLRAIHTLGFRGEALPSIGAVSKMTITTRPKDNLEGTRVVVEGGALREVSPAGCPPGTTVEVADLFYNVPARKKFLRARQTETSRIFEVCQRVALSHPELRLSVSSDGRAARQYLPARSLSERAYQVFGDIPLHEIHVERDGVKLDAALAPPEQARPGARHLFLLVNGRPITDRALARAIAFAYGDRLPPGRYPRGVVSIRVPPEDVDVNAHPQKTEVRFRRSAQLLDLVTRMIAPHVPLASSADAYWGARIGGPPPDVAAVAEDSREVVGRARVAQTQSHYDAGPTKGFRFIAQVRDRLLICEAADALVVIDRERADALRRRVALQRDLEAERLGRQSLLFPDRIELTPAQIRELARHRGLLQSLGFEWSALGEATHVVRAVPAHVADTRAASVFEAALHALDAGDAPLLDAVLVAIAETSAVRNGEPMGDDDARRIAAAVQPLREAYDPCIVARIPMSVPKTSDDDG
ncbi:MAG: DNA mismatch repair endonuclease MutL, partial [Myxococcales bacterium]